MVQATYVAVRYSSLSFRMVDLKWDLTISDTVDSSIALVDGSTVLLTPLGISVVPPPMSAFKLTLPGACICSHFCSPCSCPACTVSGVDQPTADESSWVFTSVCDKALLYIVRGSVTGEPIDTGYTVPLMHVLGLIVGYDDLQYTSYAMNSLHCSYSSHSSFLNVAITVYDHDHGTYKLTVDKEEATIPHLKGILALRVDLRSGAIISSSLELCPKDESIGKLLNCPFSCSHVGYAVHASSGYEVQLLFGLLPTTGQTNISYISSYITTEGVQLPEPCQHMTILTGGLTGSEKDANIVSFSPPAGYPTADDTSNVPPWTVVGLSKKNRLYCGEVLLMSGASSYCVNSTLGILTYITVGTRPALHYVSIAALIGLNYLHGQHTEEQYYLECGEPRPVERGASLIATVPGESRTVIQLPRGNLEVFEPRPLILMKARLLLSDQEGFYECLKLLRRQKIDLNYIVDYNPKLFMANIASFIRTTLATNADYLSLFISSLEPGNASIFKYPLAIVGQATLTPSTTTGANPMSEIIIDSLTWADFAGPQKVDHVCSYMLRELLLLLNEGKHEALNPILCCYAKPNPPLLEDALTCISSHFIGNTPVNRAAALASPKVQSAIKYLAFLAEGQKLFEAAIGQYDFVMARAVARQCQMDPKHYSPLLQRFEAITSTQVSPVPLNNGGLVA